VKDAEGGDHQESRVSGIHQPPPRNNKKLDDEKIRGESEQGDSNGQIENWEEGGLEESINMRRIRNCLHDRKVNREFWHPIWKERLDWESNITKCEGQKKKS